MNRSIQHLRADGAEWAANDIVIPDGELALLKGSSGRVILKIGDGKRRFSELHAMSGEVDTANGELIRLYHGVSYRRSELYSLTLSVPNDPDDDFFADVSFDSGEDPTEFFADAIRFTGDGTADGEFMPEANMHYSLFIWFDGGFEGVVRGVPNE